MGYAGKWEVVIDTKASQADGRKPLMPYQQEAIDRLKAFFDLTGKAEGAQSGMLVMPTGSGKTFTTVTWLLSQGVAQGYRVIWLVHRQELVEQTFREFCKLAPTLADYGVPRVKLLPVSGKHATMSMAVGNDITVASILSVASKNGMRHIRRMLGNPGKEKLVVVIDEAHHAAMPSYQKVLKRMQRINPHLVLLGLTATPRTTTACCGCSIWQRARQGIAGRCTRSASKSSSKTGSSPCRNISASPRASMAIRNTS